MDNGGKTILLVEDEAIIALMEARMLERDGYAVIHAPDGETAVAAVRAHAPKIDLVLMDIDLGRGMDGTQAAREILTDHDIPVVFLSSHTEKAIVEKTEVITSYGYVVKNSGETVILASIRMAFRLFEAGRQIRKKSMEFEATNEELNAAVEEMEATNEELVRSERQIMESERRLALAQSVAHVGSWELDLGTKVMWGSDEAFKIYGLAMPADRRLPLELVQKIPLSQDRPRLDKALAGLIAGEAPYDLVFGIRRANDGEERVIHSVARLARDEQGRPEAIFGTIQEITERARAEEELRRLIAQKETLMKELQHRVKNNLNVLISLLGLGKHRLSDENSRQIFTNAISRINAMAAIYERLYRSADPTTVDLHSYIRELAQSIIQTYQVESGRIRIETTLAEARIDTKRAVPVGLILNELISNALKYAYPDGPSGVIRVSLRNESGTLTLGVEDNGPGLPAEFNPDEQEGMGLNLVRMLADQIDAVLTIDGSHGVRVSISFEL